MIALTARTNHLPIYLNPDAVVTVGPAPNGSGSFIKTQALDTLVVTQGVAEVVDLLREFRRP